MKKQYIIILVVVVLGAAGLWVYQDHQKKADLVSHHSKQYSRMIDAAQKSSMSGMVHMGKALNKYKKKNGAYPAKLSALHPEFIPVKAFIDDLQWNYKLHGKDFYLSKTITTDGNQVLTASIGPDLMPQESSDVMVASVAKPKQKPSRKAAKSAKKSSKAADSTALTKKSKPMANAQGKLNDTNKPVVAKKLPLPELEKFTTYKLTEKEQFVHSINRKFLVWKNADGSLGFSNVQYPATNEMTIYDKGEWVQIRRKNWYAQNQKKPIK